MKYAGCPLPFEISVLHVCPTMFAVMHAVMAHGWNAAGSAKNDIAHVFVGKKKTVGVLPDSVLFITITGPV